MPGRGREEPAEETHRMKLSALKESDMILHAKEASFRALLDSTWAALKVAEIGRFSQLNVWLADSPTR